MYLTKLIFSVLFRYNFLAAATAICRGLPEEALTSKQIKKIAKKNVHKCVAVQPCNKVSRKLLITFIETFIANDGATFFSAAVKLAKKAVVGKAEE